MQQGDRKGRSLIEGVLMFFISYVLFNLDLFTIFYVTPLLLYSINNGKRKAELLIAIDMLFIVVTDILMIDGSISTKLGFAFLLIDLYIPLSLSAAGIIWMRTRGSRRLIPRLSASILPSVLLAVIAGYFISTDKALFDFVYSAFENAFAQIAGPFIEMVGADMKMVTDLFLIAFASLIVPAILCGVCACCFLYETALHSRARLLICTETAIKK